MTVSVFDLFKLGVGPSSSHTMGPMTAGGRFLAALDAAGRLGEVGRVETRLYGSLALTCVVAATRAEDAVRALHDHFIEEAAF